MLEAQLISDFADGQIGGRQFFLRFPDQLFVDVLLRAQAGQRFQQAAQIAGRHVQFFGDQLHGRQAFQHEVFAVEIVRQQLLQPVEHLVIRHFPGDELPLVEAFGVVQQRFDVGNDDILTEPVDVCLVFLPDIGDDAVDRRFFLFGQEQGFVHGIAEEIVLPDLFGQRRIPQEIRVNEQHPAVEPGRNAVFFSAQDLAGRHERHQAFVEIVFLLTVEQFVAAALEGNDVEIEHDGLNVGMVFHAAQVHQRDQRMVRLRQLHQPVDLGDGGNAVGLIVCHGCCRLKVKNNKNPRVSLPAQLLKFLEFAVPEAHQELRRNAAHPSHDARKSRPDFRFVLQYAANGLAHHVVGIHHLARVRLHHPVVLQRGVHARRHDLDDPDGSLLQLQAQHLRIRVYGRLRRAVDRRHRIAHVRNCRGNVDDRGFLLLFQVRQEGVRHPDRPRQVGRDLAVDVLEVHRFVLQIDQPHESGVVDDHAQFRESTGDFGIKPFDVLGFADVALKDLDGGKLLFGCMQRFGLAAGNEDFRALLGQLLHKFQPDAAGSAGDEDCSVLQFHAVVFWLKQSSGE